MKDRKTLAGLLEDEERRISPPPAAGRSTLETNRPGSRAATHRRGATSRRIQWARRSIPVPLPSARHPSAVRGRRAPSGFPARRDDFAAPPRSFPAPPPPPRRSPAPASQARHSDDEYQVVRDLARGQENGCAANWQAHGTKLLGASARLGPPAFPPVANRLMSARFGI